MTAAAPFDPAAACAILRVLANPTRLRIVLCLLQGERAVSELEHLLGLRQPHLSQQLAELRDAGLIIARRQSRSVVYRLDGWQTERLVAALQTGFSIGEPAAERPHPALAADPATPRPSHAATFARIGQG